MKIRNALAAAASCAVLALFATMQADAQRNRAVGEGNTKSTMTDALALANSAAAGADSDRVADRYLGVMEFDANSADDLMDHIDREIGQILAL